MKVKLKLLHVFMVMILLLGLLQPGLVLAADLTNQDDDNLVEVPLEEGTLHEEATEEGAEATTEIEVSTESAKVVEETSDAGVTTVVDTVSTEVDETEQVEISAETDGNAEEATGAAILAKENHEDKVNSEEQPETTEVEDEAEQEMVPADKEFIQEVQELDIQPFQTQDINDIISDVYLDGNEVSIDNNETDLVIHVTEEEVMLQLINVYDADGDLVGYLMDDSVNLVDLEPGENRIPFSTYYCPEFADAEDCVWQNFDVPEGEYTLDLRILYQDSHLGNVSVGPYKVVSEQEPEPDVEFSFELRPDRISQWELGRDGINFVIWGASGQDATLTIEDQTIEFEVRYFHEDTIVANLSPGTYDVEVTIGNTTETEQIVVVSDEEFYGDDASHPLLETRHMVLTKSEAEEIETIRVYADDLYEHTSIDVFVNDVRVESFYHDWGGASADIEVSGLPLGEHTIAFVHPTGSAEMILMIVPDEHGTPAPAGTYEGTTIQYIGGSHELESPFELPVKFEVDENGNIKNLEVEYWWVCVLADGQSGFSTSVEMPDTQITVNQPFQIDWEEGASPYTLVGIIHEDGTASGTFFTYSAACGMGASEWNLESDTPPVAQPEPEDFEVGLELDTTGETEGPVTVNVTTTSEADITDLKWLTGDRTEGDFAESGNDIDLETMSFTVEENGTYTIFASNAEGVVALSTIEVSNIVEPDPIDPEPTDPEPTDPEPTDPEPTDPEPTDPEPTDPEPMDPEPTDPEPTDPEPTDPEPTDPEPTDPEPTDPEPTDPEPTDPEPTDPEPTDPEPTDPEPTDPEPTDPGDGTDLGVSIDPDADSDDGTDQEISIETNDDTNAEGNKLPSTSTHLFNIIAFGTIIFVIGFTLLMLRRKQSV